MTDIIDIFAEATREDLYAEHEYKPYGLRRDKSTRYNHKEGYYNSHDPVSMFDHRMPWPTKDSGTMLLHLSTDHLLNIASKAYREDFSNWSAIQCKVMVNVVIEILADRRQTNTLFSNHDKEILF